MHKKKVTHLQLEDRVGRIARMRAAQLGTTLTEYVAGLITADADASGIAAVVGGAESDRGGNTEKGGARGSR